MLLFSRVIVVGDGSLCVGNIAGDRINEFWSYFKMVRKW